MLSGEKILVTGGSGLVGRQLIEGLVGQNEVWAASRFLEPEGRGAVINSWATSRASIDAIGAKTVAVDLMGSLDALPQDFTYVLHLAHTRLQPSQVTEAIEANSLTVGRVLHHCRSAKAALTMSSTAIYSEPDDPWQALDERADLGRFNRYYGNPTSAASKIAMEAVSRYCANIFSLPVVIMRLNVCYGPGGGMPVRNMDEVIEGRPVTRYGDPYTHSPVHFDDMRDQLEALLDSASTKANVVNWCGDEVVSQRQWCEKVGEWSGKTPILNPAGVPPGNISDPAKRRSITGPCKRPFWESFEEIYRTRPAA